MIKNIAWELFVDQLRPFFDYYQRELTYLRHSGARFAREYPKIARRLDYNTAESSDPHVERLLESFAYLTARLQRDIDDQFPRIASAMLSVLYPQFVDPLPSMAVAKFETSPKIGRLTETQTIGKKTELFTHAHDGEICRFKSCYDVELVPVHLDSAEIIATYLLDLPTGWHKTNRVLKLKLKSLAGSMGEIDLKKLRFYIAGDAITQKNLLECLFAHEASISCVFGELNKGGTSQKLAPNSLEHVGFKEDDSILPYPKQSHPGYQLLFEYFHFPEKFMFFDIKNLENSQDSKELEIYISIADNVELNPRDIGRQNFQLSCTPIVNLFEKVSEPLRFNHRATEYRLIGDQRRERTTEIHSIKKVVAVVDGVKETQEFSPYFSYNHSVKDQAKQSFWYSRRQPAVIEGNPGTDVFLSFVDNDFDPNQPVSHTIFAHTLCTNRDLAKQIPAGGTLQAEIQTPTSKIYCIERPTAQKYPNLDGIAQWKLISSLCLNHLSLSDNDQALMALKELLRLYALVDSSVVPPEIHTLKDMKTDIVTRRFGIDAWRGFVQGMKIDLWFDTSEFPDANSFLFSAVLNHFFSLYASVNSFTELEIHNLQLEGRWKRWEPISANKNLL